MSLRAQFQRYYHLKHKKPSCIQYKPHAMAAYYAPPPSSCTRLSCLSDDDDVDDVDDVDADYVCYGPCVGPCVGPTEAAEAAEAAESADAADAAEAIDAAEAADADRNGPGPADKGVGQADEGPKQADEGPKQAKKDLDFDDDGVDFIARPHETNVGFGGAVKRTR